MWISPNLLTNSLHTSARKPFPIASLTLWSRSFGFCSRRKKRPNWNILGGCTCILIMALVFLHIYVGYELTLVHAFIVPHTYYTHPPTPKHSMGQHWELNSRKTCIFPFWFLRGDMRQLDRKLSEASISSPSNLKLESHVVFLFVYWSMIMLHCYVSFCCTMMWISYMYTYSPSLLDRSPTPLGHHRAPSWAPCACWLFSWWGWRISVNCRCYGNRSVREWHNLKP